MSAIFSFSYPLLYHKKGPNKRVCCQQNRLLFLLFVMRTVCYFLDMSKQYKSSAIVLGMHDALVSLTGMIGGLTFSLTNRYDIIVSAVIASVAAGLSMGASNYLAEKTDKNTNALHAGILTGCAYIGTCILLLIPFFIINNPKNALIWSFIIAVLIIFGCNFFICRAHSKPFWRHAFEMLIICTIVSIVSFIIGDVFIKYFDN